MSPVPRFCKVKDLMLLLLPEPSLATLPKFIIISFNGLPPENTLKSGRGVALPDKETLTRLSSGSSVEIYNVSEREPGRVGSNETVTIQVSADSRAITRLLERLIRSCVLLNMLSILKLVPFPK